jgi:hypothetical protein
VRSARWTHSGVVVLVALLAACRDGGDEPAGLLSNADDSGRIRVELTGTPGRWPADILTIDSASVKSDTLYAYVSHGGGCREHEYAAVAWNGWLESHPVQVGVFVAHEADGDPCDALLRPVLRFDLTPLREAYARAYGAGPAEVVLRLTELATLNRAPLLVRYRWN